MNGPGPAAQIAFLDSVSGSTGALMKRMCAPGWSASGSEGARLLDPLDLRGTLPADTGKSGQGRSMARPRYQEGRLVVRDKPKRHVIRWKEDVVNEDGTIDRIQRAETI